MNKLFTLFLLAALPMVLSSQTVNLHAGAIPIEQQMTDEQRQTVTHLTVTGTLTDEDYAFIRTSLLKQLKELNLKEADIDTIPASALEYEDYRSYDLDWLKIVLPMKLKHLSKHSLWITNKICECELTGCFPTLESDFFYYENHGYGWDGSLEGKDLFSVSENNPYCVERLHSGIYSANLDTLYFGFAASEYIEDCKVIAGHAFEGHLMGYLEIPATVDSIGDCAFRNLRWDVATRGGDSSGNFYMVNRSMEPLMLGQNVFDGQHIYCYVYIDAMNAYKSAEGWNKLSFTPIRTESIQTTVAPANKSKIIYDLQGRQLTQAPERGMYIRNGKVVMK